MKLLRDVVDKLQNLASSISDIADAIEGHQTDTTTKDIAPESKETTSLDSMPASEVTIEALRQVMGALSLEGKRTQVKALLRKYGADKLSDVNEAEYEALMAEAVKL